MASQTTCELTFLTLVCITIKKDGIYQRDSQNHSNVRIVPKRNEIRPKSNNGLKAHTRNIEN